MKKKTIPIIVGVSIFLLYIFFELFRLAGNKEVKVKVTDEVFKDYLNLLIDAKLNVTQKETVTLYNTHLNPFSDFVYKEKYWIFITKIKTPNNINILPRIIVKQDKANLTMERVYAGLEKGYFEVNFLPDSAIVSNLYITLSGNSVKPIIQNDSIESYYIRLRSAAIDYNRNNVTDLYIHCKENKFSSIITFLRNKKSTYFILISSREPNENLDPNEIYNIIYLKK